MKMNMLRTVMLLMIIGVSGSSFAQPKKSGQKKQIPKPVSSPLDGSWVGTLTQPDNKFSFNLTIHTVKGIVSGISRIERFTPTPGIAYMNFVGTFKGNVFHFAETGIISQENGPGDWWCSKRGDLILSKDDLSGHWDDPGCNSGDVHLRRVHKVTINEHNNEIINNKFDQSKWNFYKDVEYGETVKINSGNQIAIVASSDAVPFPTLQFRFEASARPKNADGTSQSLLSTPEWLKSVSYSSATGAGHDQQFIIQATAKSPIQQWTISIPPQQDTHGNYSYYKISIYVK